MSHNYFTPMTQTYFPNPVTYNSVLGNQGNFNTAFNPLPNIPTNGYDPKAQFKNHNFANRNDTLHNNLSNIILNEEIREYSIMIDSKDRNYQIYPDPFSYEVRFKPLPKTREKVNGKYVVYEEPAPVINDNFTNVRYIKLEEAILPFFNRVRTETEENDGEICKTWKVDVNRKLTDNMYVVLSLGNEYADENYKSTNDVLSESFAIIYYDGIVNSTHYFGDSSNGLKIYPPDQLGKIDKLKISFMDPYGYPIRCTHVDKKIKSNMECTCDDPTGDENTTCFRHNLFHPLNPIFQHHLHLKVGIVEPHLNKLTFN